jgi:hypothetical protein
MCCRVCCWVVCCRGVPAPKASVLGVRKLLDSAGGAAGEGVLRDCAPCLHCGCCYFTQFSPTPSGDEPLEAGAGSTVKADNGFRTG